MPSMTLRPAGRPLWRVILPVVGLICFGAQTYSSFRFTQQLGTARGKTFWWASIRLDSDPLSRRSNFSPSQATASVNWNLVAVWDGSGFVTKGLMLTALPAFAVGVICYRALGRLGISQVWTFMVLMPPLIGAWFYFVGWLIDR